ncbi:hypothetical protein EV179_004462 [Coemansia sp. RSA 487]|nr:hypothetical protein EV179_004462 [Coemansia sp. RSA 487]
MDIVEKLRTTYSPGVIMHQHLDGQGFPMDTDALNLSNRIRSLPNWIDDKRSAEKRRLWHTWGKDAGLTDTDIAYVFDELEYYARVNKPELGLEIGCFDMIWISKDSVDNVIGTPEDLLDYDKTPILQNSCIDSPEKAIEYLGHGTRILSAKQWEQIYHDLGYEFEIDWRVLDRPAAWKSAAKLPSEVLIDRDGNAMFTTYISNVDPVKHKELYVTLGQVLTKAIPLFKEVLTDMAYPPRMRILKDPSYGADIRPEVPDIADITSDFVDKYSEWYHRTKFVPYIRNSVFEMPERPQMPFSLNEHRLQVAVHAAEYTVPPKDKWEFLISELGHQFDSPNDRIIATAEFYYGMENISYIKQAYSLFLDIGLNRYNHEFDNMPEMVYPQWVFNGANDYEIGSDDDYEIGSNSDYETEDRLDIDRSLEPSRVFGSQTITEGMCVCYSALYSSFNTHIKLVDEKRPDLVTGDGTQAAFAAPYMIKCLNERFVVHYPRLKEDEDAKSRPSNSAPWHDDWRFELPSGCRRKLSDYDLLSATFSYYEPNKDEARVVATVPLVRTSVFATVLYHTLTDLVLSSEHRIIHIDSSSHGPGIAVTELSNSSKWLVCCDASTELLQKDAHTLVSRTPVSGAVRVAFLANGGKSDELEAMIQARHAIPVGGTVRVSASQKIGVFFISWKTTDSKNKREAPLLTVFPRNHPTREDYRDIRQPLQSANWVDSVGPYLTSQGHMYAVLDSQWSLTESLEMLVELPSSGPLAAKHKTQILDIISMYVVADPELLEDTKYHGNLRLTPKANWLRKLFQSLKMF